MAAFTASSLALALAVGILPGVAEAVECSDAGKKAAKAELKIHQNTMLISDTSSRVHGHSVMHGMIQEQALMVNSAVVLVTIIL